MLHNFNILRVLKTQLKSGFMRSEPLEYYIMRRSPPLHKDSAPMFGFDQEESAKKYNFSYLKYYYSAVKKNPRLADEHVYPAFYRHEPQALTLARRQYELVKEGMKEEDAYQKAVAYVGDLENAAYVDIKSKVAIFQKIGTRESIVSDPEVLDTVMKWRSLLAEVSYDELDEADQGSLDFFVQTKILKWDEVARERRMKDPAFYMQFVKLLDSLFPNCGASKTGDYDLSSEEVMGQVKSALNVKLDKMKPFTPFYIDDYVFLLNKVKDQPLLTRWTERDRENISRWILDTLAIRDVLENSSTPKIQAYLDDLRAFFFPMIRYPSLATEMVIPSVADFKAALYDNDVGYKTQNGKVFVRRYYLLPRIMFPNETFATSIIKDEERVKQLIADPAALQAEISNSSISNASHTVVEQRLKEFYKRSYSNKPVTSPTIDFSSLEALLYGDTSGASGSSVAASSSSSSSTSSSTSQLQPGQPSPVASSGQESKEETFKRKLDAIRQAADKARASAASDLTSEPNAPLNAYEKDMADLIKALNSGASNVVSSAKRQQLDADELFRANIRKQYEEKEARRMQRVNAQREVDTLPNPDILYP